jgi:hypothetical protein
MYGIQKSYRMDVVSRVLEHGDPFAIYNLGIVDFHPNKYPLVMVRLLQSPAKRNILVSGGVHGYEPAGTLAALAFIDELRKWHEQRDSLSHHPFAEFNFYVYPCVNPSAYEAVTRRNADDVDVNRAFHADSPSQEARLVIDALKRGPEDYLMTFDLHETDPNEEDPDFDWGPNPTEFYLYEVCADKGKRVGRQMVEAVSNIVPICRWPVIYKDTNTDGVIAYPEASGNETYAGGTTFEGYLIKEGYTDHAFTIETSTAWDLHLRVKAQLKAVMTALTVSV